MLDKKPASPACQEESKKRLEKLLAAYEKNLRLEVFFIHKNDTASLLDLLPSQSDLIEALAGLLRIVQLPAEEAEALTLRLAAADALRESNKTALEQAMQAVREELEQMKAASQRIRQVRQLSKSLYREQTGARLHDYA
jgi:hypothetical protein